MANSSFMEGVHLPLRSISLPSRLPSSSLKIVAELSKFKSPDCSSSSLRAETIRANMVRLAELYVGFEELITAPLTQQAILRDRNGRAMQEALDESVTALDACGFARDLMARTKDEIQDLRSAIRRKGGINSSIEIHAQSFMSFRKNAKKDVAKYLGLFKTLESKNPNNSSKFLNLDDHLVMAVEVLKELNLVTISILKSLLIFASLTKSNTRTRGWPLVSRLMLLSSEKGGKKVFNEVESVDRAVSSIHGQATRKADGGSDALEAAREQLEILERCVEGFEDGLDQLYKCLIGNRVSILNASTAP
ncbi:uncharacterized protein LOC115736462 [Rhodamnia argentea]|uniref:Uncharacterized protein LOC115736462 n=1 Tax=Rhodamnia argentea TaxID=178133 RepID=A0A8B8NPG0_9MYRT|nr:uncharacterized protein LOC115736462 [Rhodamnia argentea]